MSSLVTDTNALIWHLFDPIKLSPKASAAFVQAIKTKSPIYVSIISLVEVTYLVEKGRFSKKVLEGIKNVLINPMLAFTDVPLDFNVAKALEQIPRDIVPDMPDRIIAATALYLNLPLVTSDHKIQASPQISTIW